MRLVPLLGVAVLLLTLAGCEGNPLEDWAYQRTAANAPEQDNPPPRAAPTASRAVNTAPLTALPPR
jgi:hypothetical protein